MASPAGQIRPDAASVSERVPRARPEAAPSFEAIYDAHVDFVWRSVCRLGVRPANREDVVQEVFLVVHRRRSDFEGRSSLQTWLYGITLGVCRNHRRRQRRKHLDHGDEAAAQLETVATASAAHPDRMAERAEAMQRVQAILDELDDDKREMFVMAELEQMRGTEIAAARGLNLNTVYARIKSAKKAFQRAFDRHTRSSDR
ncbi:MAG: sigma-70 family RNA polymerase sigma factor [Myxococcota bacterium]